MAAIILMLVLTLATLAPSSAFQRFSSSHVRAGPTVVVASSTESSDQEDLRLSLREKLMDHSDSKQENKLVRVLEQLMLLNPTKDPLRNWCARREVIETSNPLNGLWQVRYTSDSRDPSNVLGRRGPATSLRYVNASAGTWTEAAEFRQHQGKLKGFQVLCRCSSSSSSSSSLSVYQTLPVQG